MPDAYTIRPDSCFPARNQQRDRDDLPARLQGVYVVAIRI
jgi:hypothetical protein